MGDKAVPDLDMAFGYYLAVPTSVDKSGVEFHIYNGSAETWKLALVDILQNPFLKALYFRAGDIWVQRRPPWCWRTSSQSLSAALAQTGSCASLARWAQIPRPLSSACRVCHPA